MKSLRQLDAEIAQSPAAQMAMRSSRSGCVTDTLVWTVVNGPALLFPPLLLGTVPLTIYVNRYVKRLNALSMARQGIYFACPWCGRAVLSPHESNKVCRMCGREFPPPMGHAGGAPG